MKFRGVSIYKLLMLVLVIVSDIVAGDERIVLTSFYPIYITTQHNAQYVWVSVTNDMIQVKTWPKDFVPLIRQCCRIPANAGVYIAILEAIRKKNITILMHCLQGIL
jgi:hypothetical protein